MVGAGAAGAGDYAAVDAVVVDAGAVDVGVVDGWGCCVCECCDGRRCCCCSCCPGIIGCRFVLYGPGHGTAGYGIVESGYLLASTQQALWSKESSSVSSCCYKSSAEGGAGPVPVVPGPCGGKKPS